MVGVSICEKRKKNDDFILSKLTANLPKFLFKSTDFNARNTATHGCFHLFLMLHLYEILMFINRQPTTENVNQFHQNFDIHFLIL